MHVVAVTALDQALVNAMTIRTGKIGPGRGMTAIAKFRLRLGQQVLLGLGVMRTVAVHTTHIVARMGRNRVVALRLRFPVTLQATLARLRSRKLAKTNDLRFVPAPGDVLRAGSVARLAAMPVFLHGLEVRRAFELLLVHILVARHTGFGSGILSRTRPFRRRRFVGGRCPRSQRRPQHNHPYSKSLCHRIHSCLSFGERRIAPRSTDSCQRILSEKFAWLRLLWNGGE